MKLINLKFFIYLLVSLIVTTSVVASEKPVLKEKSEKAKVVKEDVASEKVEKRKTKLKLKEKIKIIKQLRKLKKESKKKGTMADVPFILLIILAILLPPLAVWLHAEDVTKLVISIILTLLFWLPGIIYAFLVLFDIV